MNNCKFCDEPVYQLCKVEVVGYETENYVIGLCFKHFNAVAKTLSLESKEVLQ